jgi:hypothetical protein
VNISTPPLLCYLHSIIRDLGQPPIRSLPTHSFPLIAFPVIHSFRCYLSVSHTLPESEEGKMRSPDPMLPSITFVLSQAQSPVETRGNKRWGKLGVRRTKSSPSFSPHPPRYPPRLDSEFLTVNMTFSFRTPPPPPFLLHPSAPIENLILFLSLIIDRDSHEKTVDYRFTSPPRAPSRSSFALVRTNIPSLTSLTAYR